MTTGEPTTSEPRERVAEAVWRVLDRDGFVGLSMRAVAAEMGATTGAVTHHFRSKRELTDYALDLLATRSAERRRRVAEGARPALRAALLDMLPLDRASLTANRIWVASWDAALADPRRAAAHADRYCASRVRVAELVRLATASSDAGGTDRIAEHLHAAVLGLCTQAVLDPAAYPAQRLTRLLDDLLLRVLGPEVGSSA